MSHAKAYAKINLALVVGPLRDDGKHEVVTVLQRIDLHDDVALEFSDGLVVEGFPDDTIVRRALEALARAARIDPHWRVRIDKRIPVAAGLGGGSADAATALALANSELDVPLSLDELHRLAAAVGADVPFFLHAGSQLGTGDGTELAGIDLPTDYYVLVVVPNGEVKPSSGAVYERFDKREGPLGFEDRVTRLRSSLESVSAARDLARLPLNDLASSVIAAELLQAGAIRADVTGAGPAVYGLFERQGDAALAERILAGAAWTALARPVLDH
jgi:4-diphosphocytidyl-2-C-methyl-D-erythritol kinase